MMYRQSSIRFSCFVSVLVAVQIVTLIARPAFAATLAIADFQNDSGRQDLEYMSHSIPTMLIMDLNKTGLINVVDRSQFDRVLDEQKLSLSDLVERRTENNLGKLLGVEHFVSGSFTKLRSNLRIDIKLVDVNTGRKIGFSQTGPDENAVHRLSEALVQYLAVKDVSLQVESPQNLLPPDPWYKRWYVWAIVGVVVAGVAIAASGSSGEGGQGGAGGIGGLR